MARSKKFYSTLTKLKAELSSLNKSPLIDQCLIDIAHLITGVISLKEYQIDKNNPFDLLQESLPTGDDNLGKKILAAIKEEKSKYNTQEIPSQEGPLLSPMAKFVLNEIATTLGESITITVNTEDNAEFIQSLCNIKDRFDGESSTLENDDDLMALIKEIIITISSNTELFSQSQTGQNLLAWAKEVSRPFQKLSLPTNSKTVSDSDSESEPEFVLENDHSEQEKRSARKTSSSPTISSKELSEKLDQIINDACVKQAGDALIDKLLNIKNEIEEDNPPLQNIIGMINANAELVQSNIGKELLACIEKVSQPSQKPSLSTKRKADSDDETLLQQDNNNNSNHKRVKIDSTEAAIPQKQKSASASSTSEANTSSTKPESSTSDLIISEELMSGNVLPKFDMVLITALEKSVPPPEYIYYGVSSEKTVAPLTAYSTQEEMQTEDDFELQEAIRMSRETLKPHRKDPSIDTQEIEIQESSFATTDDCEDDQLEMAIKMSLQSESKTQLNESPSRAQVETLTNTLSNLFSETASSNAKPMQHLKDHK